jgi:hypothetical protein
LTENYKSMLTHAHANATQQLHREQYGRQNPTGRMSDASERTSPALGARQEQDESKPAEESTRR